MQISQTGPSEFEDCAEALFILRKKGTLKDYC